MHPESMALWVDAAEGRPNWDEIFKDYQSAVDYPTAAYWRQIADHYPDAKVLHDRLVAANPERLMWGTDWPHPSIPVDVMPDDGHLLDLFHDWTPDAQVRRQVLVETPTRLFGK